jgi:hypothetical protein
VTTTYPILSREIGNTFVLRRLDMNERIREREIIKAAHTYEELSLLIAPVMRAPVRPSKSIHPRNA